jgi:hypothetical protein
MKNARLKTILKNKKTWVLIEGISYLTIIYIIILVSFRYVRSSLAIDSKNIQADIVGYSQYFGYPLYFETIIFFIFVLSPIVVFYILSKIRKI